MRSMLHALTWDYFRYTGWLTTSLWALSFSPLFIYAALKPLGVQPGDQVMLLLEVSLLPAVIFVLLLSACTSVATCGNLTLKPISNLSIASWRLGSGAVVLLIQLGLVIWVHNRVYNVGWPMTGAILFALATWSVAQPFLCLGGKSLSRMFVTGIPLLLMCVWYIARYKDFGSPGSLKLHGLARDWNAPSTWEVVQLLSIAGLFAVLTVRCVAIDRCGDSTKPTRLYFWLIRTASAWWNSGTRERKPFRSAMSAQLWYEFQIKGWLLPAVFAALIVVMAVGTWLEGKTLHERLESQIVLVHLMSFCSGLVGGMIGSNLQGMRLRADSVRTDMLHIQGLESLGSFQSTRPISDRQYANTQLKTCASNWLLGIAVWCLLALPMFIYAWKIGLPYHWEREPSWYALVLSILGGWALMSNSMTAIASGRGRSLLRWQCVGFLTIAFGAAALNWFNIPRLTQLASWATIISLSVGVLVATIWLYRRAYQQRFIYLIEIVVASMIAIGIVAISVAILPKVGVAGFIGLVDLGLLCVLPLASAPLAVYWNRHR